MARSSSCDRLFSLRQKWNSVPSLRCRPMRTFSSSVQCGNTAEIWKDRITPRRAICAGASRVMSSPLKRMVPEVGSRNLVSRLKQVVLPAPLGPIKAWMEDRKSTRLNSSHLVISYAVFCLKKKKQFNDTAVPCLPPVHQRHTEDTEQAASRAKRPG